MMRNDLIKLLWGIAVLACAGIIVATLQHVTPPAAPPSIALTNPAGGEHWQAGETHVVSWKSTGIPAADKIALTLRRIPPPPLPAEGQEFDPVIAINLPNTGNASWTIASMYPSGTYALGIAAYKEIPVTDAVSAESAPFTITHPVLAADLYPLYAPADWGASEAEQFTIGTTSYSGARVVAAPIAASNDPGSIITPFEKYYDAKLKARGWTIANDLAAGGHVGGQTGYRKGGEVVLVRFAIQYDVVPQNAPSECPCSVTLSLFSQRTGQ
jgi:hypothetical protein